MKQYIFYGEGEGFLVMANNMSEAYDKMQAVLDQREIEDYGAYDLCVCILSSSNIIL